MASRYAVAPLLSQDTDIDLFALLAQLKINLRPLWALAIRTLGTLASTGGCGEEVWDVVFGELERVCRDPGSFGLRAPEAEVESGREDEIKSSHEDNMDVDDEREEGGEWEEEEWTWRCPSAIRFITIVERWQKDRIAASEASLGVLHLCLISELIVDLGPEVAR
jgi:hypothetical protein